MAHNEVVTSNYDTNCNNNSEYKKDFRTALPQLLAVSVKNLLILGYGTTLGFVTIVIPAVEKPRQDEVLHLEKHEISWISSIHFIVVPLGCALSGVVSTPVGRRRAMQMVNVPFFIAWLLFYFSTRTTHLYGALILTGLGGGLLEAPVLTYVAEVTQPHLRGALAASSSLSIIIGVFTQFLFGLFFYWRTVALINIIFTVLAVVALCFVPESPFWLVSKKRDDEARKSLQWLRGWTSPQAVEQELKEIQALFKNQDDSDNRKETLLQMITHYTERSFLIPFLLIGYCFFVGHFSGMTSLQTYAVSIFQMLEAPLDKYRATLILGILQILGTASCVLLVHYTGKRPITFFSTGGAGICCILIAVYDVYIRAYGIPRDVSTMNFMSNATNTTQDGELNNDSNNPYSWMPTTLLMLLAMITHTGIKLLPWILIGEIFNSKTRSGGAGLASAVGYIFGFFTNKMYISMVDNLSIWGTYSLYGIVCLSACVVFYFILPETEGKTLNDIENHFAGIKTLTNEVHRSKKRVICDVSQMQDIKGKTNPSFEGDNVTS